MVSIEIFDGNMVDGGWPSSALGSASKGDQSFSDDILPMLSN
jgi:hypothetical protein